MEAIYLDRDQCELFSLPNADAYDGPRGTKVIVAASTLLNSKGGTKAKAA